MLGLIGDLGVVVISALRLVSWEFIQMHAIGSITHPSCWVFLLAISVLGVSADRSILSAEIVFHWLF
jgi:hypothetical protein